MAGQAGVKGGEQHLMAGPDRGQGAHGPLQGSGQSPEVLPLVSPAGSVGAEQEFMQSMNSTPHGDQRP